MFSIKNYSAIPDGELVGLALRGDSDAYCELVVRYKGSVFGVVRRIVSDYHAAEDIAQDCFTDGYLQLSGLKEPEKACAWFCGIARRKALRYASRLRRFEDIEELSEALYSENASPEDIFIKNEASHAVRRALDSLSEKNRAVVRLYYIADSPVSEISRRLALPEGTVRRRLHDARVKLKGELAYMNDNRQSLSSDFEREIMERIKKLQGYYALGNIPDNGFKETYSETEGMISRLPESKVKQSALAELYMCSYQHDGKSGELRDKIMKAAQDGNNPDIMCDILVDDIIGRRDNDYTSHIKSIDEDAIPQMEKMNSPQHMGAILFWRGNRKLLNKDAEGAEIDFSEAVRLVAPENIYHANAVAAVRAIKYIREYADSLYEGYYVLGEQISLRENMLSFDGQPGFSFASVMEGRHKFDCIFYFASRFDNMFYDTSMKTGETRTSADGLSELTLVSMDEYVETIAGKFNGCMHIRYANPNEYDADIWYADGTGMVKAAFRNGATREEYELAEYTVHGGQGYMPAHTGNRWRYVKPDLPDYLYQWYEREIDWTDGKSMNFSVLQLVAMKKGYLSSGELDSEICIKRCESLCGEWKLDEAIEALRLAVRKNSTQNAAMTALAGIAYLKKFKEYQEKGCRFCPSSFNSSLITLGGGAVRYNESGLYSFGPYRWGSRYEENRIFGVKPFRYLQQLLGKIYDDKWIPGYTEESHTDEGRTEVRLSVSDAGTVSVRAGSFENCLKLTLSARHTTMEGDYYFNEFQYTHCGLKEFWLAPGVGIVRFDCTWGTTLKSSSELTSYSLPAAGEEYMPVQIGNRWEYEEVNLTSEGYCAKRNMEIACGMDGRFLMTDNQEFVFLGTEEEYEAFKAKTRA